MLVHIEQARNLTVLDLPEVAKTVIAGTVSSTLCTVMDHARYMTTRETRDSLNFILRRRCL